MKTDSFNRKTVVAIVALAFFNFVFLGAEYMYDNMMAYIVDAKGVVLAESYILGASCIGFLCFPFLDKILKSSTRYIVAFAGALLGIICIFVIGQHSSYVSVLIPGCILFVILGTLGSAIHYKFSIVIADKRHLAKCIGIAYALGIFIQFINNNLVKNDMAESIFISITLAVFVVLLIKTEDYMSSDEVQCSEGKYVLKNHVIAGVSIIGVVVLMSCIFSTLNISVTLVHADGSVDIGQWPRLLLAVSGLTAGFLYDIKGRKYMNIIMYCVTLLSTVCVVVTELSDSFLVGLIIFYMSAGFFVVFFSTAFIDLSYYMKLPQLWAGLGRATNNACAIITGNLSVILLSEGGMRIIITALVLFTLISIVQFIYSSQFEKNDTEKVEIYEMSDEERFSSFCDAFSISGREREVLSALLVSDENVQDIAVKLYMSRAVLYRHISSLNEKTETKSRIGLLQFYYTWKDKK